MTDAQAPKPEDKVAPADAHYAQIGVPLDEREDRYGVVHPAVAHPDQPTFPAPVGLDRATLEAAGVDHHYLPGGVRRRS